MIDLHIHSCYSDDGEESPTQIIEKCAKAGISIVSITDQNTVKANEEASNYAKKLGITYINGAEFDCLFNEKKVQILAYGIDFNSDEFVQIENYVDDESYKVSLEMLELTEELGFHISENDLWKLSQKKYFPGRWTGEMFTKVLFSKVENEEHSLLRPYRAGGIKSDAPYTNFCRDFYSKGKCCYVEPRYLQMKHIIDIIHRNKGIAVLAHPGLRIKEDERLLERLLAQGLDGIEVYNDCHSREQVKFYETKAKEREVLLMSGGCYQRINSRRTNGKENIL